MLRIRSMLRRAVLVVLTVCALAAGGASAAKTPTPRLAGPIGAHRPDAVFHGHAHHGTAQACIGEVPVWNVARQVTDEDFAIVEV